MKTADALKIADMFYDAATDPGRWRDALQALADFFDAPGAAIWSSPFSGNFVASPSIDSRVDDYLRQGWASHDSLTLRAAALRRSFDLAGEHSVMTQAEIDRDPFFQEFRRSAGFGGVIARTDMSGAPETDSIITIQRAPNQPFPEGDDAIIARRLLGHVARARAAAVLTLRAADWAQPLTEAIESCPVALAVVTALGRVVQTNRAFRRIDALRVDKGQLQATTAGGTATLLSLIAGTAQPNLDHDGQDCAIVRRDATSAPVVVRAVSLTPDRTTAHDGLIGGSGRRVLIVAVDTGATTTADGLGGLRKLGLTRAEARLALEIGRGLATRDVARALGVSEHTVRSQMRAIFAKLDVSRQSELVRLTTRLEVLSRPDASG